MLSTIIALFCLASAIIGGLTFLWNYIAHDNTSMYVAINNQISARTDAQVEWIQTLGETSQEVERLQKAVVDFYKSMRTFANPSKAYRVSRHTEVDLELGLGTSVATQCRDPAYKWSLPPIF